jgi:hypothetical protein
MRRSDFGQGWYVDALPSGQYAVAPFAGQGQLRTSHGAVDLPGEPFLYTVIAPDGVQIAGVGNATDRAWRWDGQRWHDHGLAFGPQPLIFVAGGLRIVTGPPAHGYRYLDPVSGQPVTCSDTYADTNRQIWEYTELAGGLVIGQGGEGPHGDDPLIALWRGRRILIQPGRCRIIKASWDGETISIAWVQEDAVVASVLWLTLAELLTFPDVSTVVPPAPQPVPPPPPVPIPVPPMALPASLFEHVKDVRARVDGLPTPEQLGQMLNEVAWRNRLAGWGLSRKNGGNRVPFPGGGTIAADILHHQPTDTLWDVFNAATGPDATATATWGQTEHHHDPDRPWVAPVQPAGGDDGDPGDENEPKPEPTPEPQPACTCADLIAALHAKIDALTDRVVTLETQPDSAIVDLVNAKVDAKIAAALTHALADVARIGYPVRVNLTLSATLRGRIEKP